VVDIVENGGAGASRVKSEQKDKKLQLHVINTL
jgi:hypothetical protein